MEQNAGISKYTKYGAVTRNMECDPYFRTLEESLVKTLDFLDSRYLITNTYNYFEDPSNQHRREMLFKAYNESQMVMWVYFIFSERSKYISIEVPGDVNNIIGSLSGFDDVIRRKTPPPLKLIFSDYNRIEESLKIICDYSDNGSIVNKDVVSSSINTPLRPKNIIRKADGTIRFVCGRCAQSFVKAQRCPECGQLVKE